MKQIGYGQSSSKIILMGEHSVVYGYPALALPIKDIQVTCQIKESPQTNKVNFDQQDTLERAIWLAQDYLKVQNYNLIAEIDSAIPQHRGMGSSAAVSLAAIRAVFDYFETPLPNDLLEDLANQAEKIAHRNPSGLDVKACMSQQAIKFIKNQGFSTIDLPSSAYLVIADTGILGHTREAVEHIKQQKEKALPLLEALGQLTQEAEVAIFENNLIKLGHCMTNAHRILKELGVSCDLSDELVTIALQSGALGAKMTGGGLGGCIICLVKYHDQAQTLRQILEEKGAVKTWLEEV